MSAASEGAEARAAEARFQEQVARDLPRNYGSHLLHGLLGQTGFRLIQAPTFVEAYVQSVTGSPLAIAAVRASQGLGMLLSPILGATRIEHRPRVLPLGFAIGSLMRVQLLGVALAAFFLQGLPALAAIAFFLGLFGFFMGMQNVIFTFLLSKTIPVERRGRLLGLRNALAGIVAGATGWLGGWLVEHDALGNGFAATFLVAFCLTSLGLAMLLGVREPVPPRVRERTGMQDRLRQLPALLRGDPDFTRYFLARALATLGRMSVPFYVPYASLRTELGGRELGELTLSFTAAMSVMNLGWGWIADRFGFRVVFIASLTLWVASALLLMSTTDYGALLAVLFGLGAGLGGFMMSSHNLVLEFGERGDLPLRIAVATTASEATGVVGTLLAGVLVLTVSHEAMFWTAIAFQAAAIAWVVGFVREPRHH